MLKVKLLYMIILVYLSTQKKFTYEDKRILKQFEK